mgnify:CR=1 FL=1
MNLPTNPDELKKLVELAYLGEWLVNAHHDNEFQDETATAAVQKLFEAAKLKDIEQDAETGNYYLETAWSDRLFEQYILDYDEHVFWDELVERLAQRDLARERGVAIDQITRDEDIRELLPLEERYRRELEEHGVERLDLATDY